MNDYNRTPNPPNPPNPTPRRMFHATLIVVSALSFTVSADLFWRYMNGLVLVSSIVLLLWHPLTGVMRGPRE